MNKFIPTLFIGIALAPSVAHSSAVIFSGNDVKTLRQNINLFDQAKILTGTDDPTVVAKNAPRGSLYLRVGVAGGSVYRKTDAGSSTNWNRLADAFVAGALPFKFEWTQAFDGLAPLEHYLVQGKAFLFAAGSVNPVAVSLQAFLKVPASYVAGNPIKLTQQMDSGSTANSFDFTLTSTLVIANTTSVVSTTNQNTSTISTANVATGQAIRNVVFDVTTAIGQINGVAVSPGDLIKLKLSRSTADTDVNLVRVWPSAEVTFQ